MRCEPQLFINEVANLGESLVPDLDGEQASALVAQAVTIAATLP
jgi:hypothetical protein